jgi:PAS domain-containing protein
MSDKPGIPPRRLSGSSFAYPIQQLLRGYSGVIPTMPAERVLGGWVLPPFQRPPVWTEAQKVRLVESIWLGYPIGVFIFNMRHGGTECDGWLLDGQQRMTALLGYVADEFEVFGLRWSEVPHDRQRDFMMRPLACVETSFETPEECREIYDRMAYGGTPHELVEVRP